MQPPSDVERFLPLPDLPHHILLALAGQEMSHGWGVIKRINELTQGRASPSTGSVYLAIGRLEERGLIETAPAPPDERDQRRRFHRLTPMGRRVLAAESERLARLVEVAREAGVYPDARSRVEIP